MNLLSRILPLSFSDWKKRIIKILNSKWGLIVVLLGPIEILLNFLVLLPFALEIWVSFTSWQPQFSEWTSAPFVGLANYIDLLFKNTRFLMSIARTLLLVAICVPIELLFGLVFATLFCREFKGKRLLFVTYLTPVMMVPVIVGYMFYMIVQPEGPLNHVISLITGKTFTVMWLSHPILSLVSIIITDIWHWTPLMFLILYSGLIALPENPIKAAKVLGASDWRIFRDIKLPMLKNLVLLAASFRVMEIMKLFDEIFIMTGGGPGFMTETLSTYIQLTTMKYMRIGYSSAAALIVLCITVFLITRLMKPTLKVMRR